MILADKIIHHRKLLDLTQEELAEKLNVSRQSISKWEGALSIPDMNKIIVLSEVFGVSIDYLLKDDIQTSETVEEKPQIRIVDLETANTFLEENTTVSKLVSAGVALCILSPVMLIYLSTSENSETFGVGVGLLILMPLIALAVGLFIKSGMISSRNNFMEKEIFDLAFGVESVIKKRKEAYHKTYTNAIIMGVMLLILSVAPIFIVQLILENEAYIKYSVPLLLILVSIGVYILVRASIIQSGFEMLLQENEYSQQSKDRNKIVDKIAAIYWPTMTAIYLYLSFSTNNWGNTWIIWPIAGIGFAVIAGIISLFSSDN